MRQVTDETLTTELEQQLARELGMLRTAARQLKEAAASYRTAVRGADVREMPLVDAELLTAMRKMGALLPAAERLL
jgi:hypothetical protein